MSSPTNSPTKRRRDGIPVGWMIIILGSLALAGFVGIGVWSLSGSIKLTTIPVKGEWQAKDKPWRLEFREDKTIVSSTAPSLQSPSQAWTSEPGRYKVDYAGTLWVMLKNGTTYSASLAPPPGDLAPVSPNRFDLIDSVTQGVTVFERTVPIKPNPPDAAKGS